MRQDTDREPNEPLGGWRGEWAVQRDEPRPEPPEPLFIDPADWDAEQQEREAGERLEREHELAKLEPGAAETFPAKRMRAGR